MRRPTIARSFAAFLVAIAGACGRSETPASEARPSASRASPSATVTDEDLAAADILLITGEVKDDLEVGGYGFTREEISSPGPTIEVEAGEPVTLALKNVHGYLDGEDIDHDFAVVAEKREGSEPLWGSMTENLDPQQAGLVTFTPQAPGRYFYVCTIVSHLSAHGMWGRFVVR